MARRDRRNKRDDASRCRVFSIHPALPNSTSIRSVPADTRVREERINNWSRLGGFHRINDRHDLHKVGA